MGTKSSMAAATMAAMALVTACGGEVAPSAGGGAGAGGDTGGGSTSGGGSGGGVTPASLDCGDAPRIAVAPVDGAAAGLAVDATSVYALLAAHGSSGDAWLLERAPKCGGAPVTLARGDGAPAALALTSTDVVLSHFESGSAAIVVARVPKTGGDVVRVYETLYGPDVPSDLAVDGDTAWITNPDFDGVERVALDATGQRDYVVKGAAYVAAGGGALFAVADGAVTRLDVATKATVSSGRLLATDVRFVRLVGDRVVVGGEYVWDLAASDLRTTTGAPRTAGWGGAMLGMAADAAATWVAVETTSGGPVELVSLPAGTPSARVVATSSDAGLAKAPVALDERAAYWISAGTIERWRR